MACTVALCGALGCSVYDESMLTSDGGAAATGGSGGTGVGKGGSTSTGGSAGTITGVGGSAGAATGGSGGSGATGGTAGKGGADAGAGKGGASGSSGASGTGGTGGASGTGGSGTTGGAAGVGGAAGTAGTGATGGASGTGTGTGGAAGSGGAAGTGGTGATGGAAGTSGTGGAAGSAGTGGTGGGTVDAGPDGGPGPTGGGNTLIIAEHSGKCMTVIGNGTADGTNIEQQPCTSSSGQIYRFQNQGGGIYKILHVASGRYVSGNGPATNNYVVEIRTSSTSTLQQFNVVLDTGVYYNLVNLFAGNCVDVYFQQTSDGTEYVTYQCNGGSNQAFRFVSP